MVYYRYRREGTTMTNFFNDLFELTGEDKLTTSTIVSMLAFGGIGFLVLAFGTTLFFF